MAYAVPDDLLSTYARDYVADAGDFDGDGMPDPVQVGIALDDASSLADKHLGARYSVPISPVPAWLRHAVIDIAIYYLSATADTCTDEKRRRYEDALKCLMEAASGDGSLGVPSDLPPAITIDSEPRALTRGTLCPIL